MILIALHKVAGFKKKQPHDASWSETLGVNINMGMHRGSSTDTYLRYAVPGKIPATSDVVAPSHCCHVALERSRFRTTAVQCA